MSRLVLTLLNICLVTINSCGYGGKYDNDEEAKEGVSRGDSLEVDILGAKAVVAVPVETLVVNRGSISDYLSYNSTVETEDAVQIFPEIGGMVKYVTAEEGDRVESGDTLLVIEDEQLRIAYEEAETNLKFQETNFSRNEEMFKRRLISDQEYETKKFEFSQARLRYARAKLELENSTILAPFSGVITERYIQVGARVNSGTQLFELIKLEDMIVRVFIPGQYLLQVAKGQKAVITSDFLSGQEFTGWVKRISPVVDPGSGTFKVTVGIRDQFESLRPGMFVSVRIVTDTHHDAILLPKQAIVYDGGDKYVFVLRDTVAKRILLKVGYDETDFIESLIGIKEGEQVIVVGQNGLKDGVRVRSVNMFGTDEIATDSTSVEVKKSE
ncbi:MAG: efflux RND transporter periplasmic adaptor subunit [Candidatus Latescibacterota bacterium]|nr:efflux RND transporter periplasmic adaptor subunit [Candidatus Latescibacterota bacterium]